MDIRRFFKKKTESGNESKPLDLLESEPSTSITVLSTLEVVAEASDSDSSSSHAVVDPVRDPDSNATSLSGVAAGENQSTHPLDIGNFIGNHASISDETKYALLTRHFVPDKSYDFKRDTDGKRIFRHEWIQNYDWLAYSSKLKGGLCINCVVFRPTLRRGLFGSFIVKPFQNYKDFHESAKKHMSSEWHRSSTIKVVNFRKIMEGRSACVTEQLSSYEREMVKSNRDKLVPILSTIIFCGTHDLPFRGKTTGNFDDLLNFRVESGDSVLKSHLENCAKNAKYTSHQTQNELLTICGDIIREDIIAEVNASDGFSILADESADISGVEQLSVGVRFVDENNSVREEFIGFTELTSMTAVGISSAILEVCENNGLNMQKLVGLGFDGCATMAGRENGVQKIIREKYNKALFFHCASHRLNLVVNDLNKIQEVQHSVDLIKKVITFFRESPYRRKYVPKIPLFCETRWSAKYKSIRIFSEHFEEIRNALEHLSNTMEVNGDTRSKANQLLCAISNSKFIVCLRIISHYSAKLEPVCNILQAKTINLLSTRKHIQILLSTLKGHRDNAVTYFKAIFQKCVLDGEKFDVDIKIPRLAARQTQRANYATDNVEDYFRYSLFIPYLDSVIQSIEIRFSQETEDAYALSIFHPHLITNDEKFSVLRTKIHTISELYGIENLNVEAETWKEMWVSKLDTDLEQLELVGLIGEHCQFFPNIRKVLKIFLALPPTTTTIERSFSTLRRVKTWLRSTMSEERLSGLCMLSVHRELVNKNKNIIIEKSINRFAQKRRNLLLLFSH